MADFMHLDYICGRFYAFRLYFGRFYVPSRYLWHTYYLMAGLSCIKKNVTNWISRLAFLGQIGILFLLHGSLFPELADLFSQTGRFLLKIYSYFLNLKVAGQLGQVNCSGRLTLRLPGFPFSTHIAVLLSSGSKGHFPIPLPIPRW